MQELAPAADDDLGHDDERQRLAVLGELAHVAKQRLADVAVGRLDELERDVEAVGPPLRGRRCACSSSKAKETACASSTPSVLT